MRGRGQEQRRVVVLSIAALFVLSACSGLAANDVALVSGPPASAAAVAAAERAKPPAKARSAPTQQARPDIGDDRARPEPEPTPKPKDKAKLKTVRLQPRPKAGPFQIDLFTKGDFMHQATKDMCVAGSTQTMMNIIDTGRPDRSTASQRRLYERGRQLSPSKTKLGPIGVDLTGWAELLNTGGYGPYVVDGAGTRRGAIRKAARALRVTNRPVGLVTWRGAHSWVMSGFTATADPAHTRDFEVTAVYIEDTWYPYVSTIWGASRPPDTLVPVAALAEDYLPYARPRARYPKRDGKFMLILPELPPNTVVR